MQAEKNKHAVELGKMGGKANTPAKIKAARINGKKGGRPVSIKSLKLTHE